MYDRIPQEFKENEPFCLWRIENDKKVPYQITGQRADSSNPATFAGYDDVMSCFDDRYLGIGVLTTTFTKIDIDDYVEDGTLSPLAEEVVDAINSYTEFSPSGTGIHIICYTPGIRYDKSRYYMNNRAIGMEVYVPGQTNRFFTVTGDVFRDMGIEERTAEVEKILEKYMVRPESNRETVDAPGSYLSDDSVLEKANASKQGQKFNELWQGHWHGKYGSQSEADMAFASMLAFWCGGDHDQIDRLFRRSALYRPKWDERHGAETYGDMTITKAVRLCRSFYLPVTTEAEDDFNDLLQMVNEAAPESNWRYKSQDIGCGRLYADLFKRIARYVPERKSWFVFDGMKWVQDVGNLKAMELCKDLADALIDHVKDIHDEDARKAYLKYCTKWQMRRNRETYLKDAQGVYPISATEFDSKKSLLNLQNGTLNLETMEFHEHDPEDLITKVAPVDYVPTARSERFLSFIEEIMSGDQEKAEFLQMSLGYALSGDSRYECMFILYGETTRNGKGTLMESILRIFGDYGKAVRPETIAQKNKVDSQAPSEDVARLAGLRFVNIAEPRRGMVMNAAQVKNMTGNDTLNARFLHENSFDFEPQFKIYINTNYLPDVTDMTLFSSGRILIIPFDRHFEEWEQDKTLKETFRKPEVQSAILNWLIEGFQILRTKGFRIPDAVAAATESYCQESDKIRQFMEDCLKEDGSAECRTAEAYESYKRWCAANGCYPENSKHFNQALRQYGKIVRKRPRGGGEKTTLLIGYRIVPEEFL